MSQTPSAAEGEYSRSFTSEGLARLFEGEGTACVLRNKERKPSGMLSLGMTDEEVVRAFASSIGRGTVTVIDRAPHKTQWRWSTGKRSDIEWFAENIAPYLFSRRRAQVQAALEAARESSKRYTHSLVQEMFGRSLGELSEEERTAYNAESFRRWRKRKKA